MSKPIKRYVNGRFGLDPHESGEWVKWDDYSALAAENERMLEAWVDKKMEQDRDALLAENERLREAWIDKKMEQDRDALLAENERLRKAGDAMYNAALQDSTGLWLLNPFQDWAKAKEGGAK